MGRKWHLHAFACGCFFISQNTQKGRKGGVADKELRSKTMNCVILSGRVTRDPEVRWSTGNDATCVARFTLAVKKRVVREGEENADFFNCVIFGKRAEWTERYMRKGMRFEIKGYIAQSSYTNKDGQKVNTTEIHVEDIDFGESKQASENAVSNGNNGYGNTAPVNGGPVAQGAQGGNVNRQGYGRNENANNGGYNAIPDNVGGFNSYYGHN